jgi:hypothetical protein
LIDGWSQGNLASSVSSLRRIMTDYIFKTPIAEEAPIGKHRLFYFRKANKGISVVKQSGVYKQYRFPLDPSVESYEEFYQGGRNHTVTEATKTALIAAGIGVTEANFTAI